MSATAIEGKAGRHNTVTPAHVSQAGAAQYSSLSQMTINRLIASGRLRGYRVGGRVLVAYADLDALIKTGEIEPAEPAGAG